jgi:hypothetical protein
MAMTPRAQWSRSEMAKSVSRWKSAPSGGATSEQRRNLWTALAEFVRQNGGFVVSLQFTSPLRLEVPTNSPLPERLRALGYDPIFVEQASRFGPIIAAEPVLRKRRVTTPTDGFRAVDIFEVRLPK